MKKRFYLFVIVILILLLSLAITFLYRRKEQVISEPPLYTGKETKNVRLYFALPKTPYLKAEERRIYITPDINSQAKQAILELLQGPKEGLSRTIPPETKLREIYIDKDGWAYVDFSREIKERHPGGTEGEILTIYSIVNTLTLNFPQITKVQILVEGEEVETLAGHIYTLKPFSQKMSLIRK